MATGVSERKATVPLVFALANLKHGSPGLFQQFMAALQHYAAPEYQGLLKAPPDIVLVAQGRAQIVDEILNLGAECSELEAKYRATEKRGSDATTKP